ncbi:MAG: glycosyltransferase family 39 protein, partial [Burkholderiaceae bacterium]
FVYKIPHLTHDPYEIPLYQTYPYWVAAAALLSLIGSLFAAWIAHRQKEWAIVALAVSGFVGGQLILLGHDPLGRYASGYIHIAAVEAELTPQTALYAVGRYEQSLPFYLKRTMTLVENADEMEFGLQQEPQLWIPTVDAFVVKWNADHANHKKDMAIMRTDIFSALQKRDVPMRVIAQDPRRVIVTNDIK